MWFVLGFVCLWLLCLAAWVFVRDWRDPRRKLPGMPLVDPFFGNLLLCVLIKGRIITPFMEQLAAYGRVRRMYLFLGEIRAVVSDPDALLHILVGNASNYGRGNYAGMEHITEFVGESSLIMVDGERHRRLRRVASPAFRPSALRAFFPTFHLGARRLVAHWRGLLAQHPGHSAQLELKSGLTKATLDVIGLAAFGRDYACFDDEASPERAAVSSLLQGGGISLWAVFPFYRSIFKLRRALASLAPDFLVRHWDWLAVEAKLRVVRQGVADMITRRKAELGRSEGGGPANLLDFTLASEEAGSVHPKELVDMVMTFMLAGHETSSIGLSWTLLLLAQHPEWLAKAQTEVDALFEGLGEREMGWDEVRSLPTLAMCLKEALRLFPPIPYVNRRTLGPDTLLGHPIPAGTDVLLVTMEVHRNAELWGPDAALFRPERFEGGAEPGGGLYLPFGDGAHKCIGYQFSLNEMSVFLAHLLHNFHLDTVPGLKFHELADISLKPSPALSLVLTDRRPQA